MSVEVGALVECAARKRLIGFDGVELDKLGIDAPLVENNRDVPERTIFRL